MKWSHTGIKTLRETPSDTVLPSHTLLVRGGFIKKLSSGLFTYGPLMVRVIQKFEKIVREELKKENCTEILMPMTQPKEIWEQSGRWKSFDHLLQKMINRQGQEFCLGPTHEEVVSNYVKNNINSYRDLPLRLYQIQTKFRDEIRPRFGLMRAREFIMKDAYSFDLSSAEAEKSYQTFRRIYSLIFSRLGVDFRVVKADSGEIGGDRSEEFHILAEHGEDELLVTDSYAANKEVCALAPVKGASSQKIPPREEFHTPNIKTIEALSKSLKVPEEELVKILFLACENHSDKNIAVLLRGSDELNLFKVKKELGLEQNPTMLLAAEIKKLSGVSPGSCGPVGLSIPIYMDQALRGLTSFITGANREDHHLKNVVPGRDFNPVAVGDFRYATAGDKGPDNKELRSYRGIEVGHIFCLGSKYAEKMGVHYLDSASKKHSVKMGCYGIGITRTVQAVVEQSCDKEGIIWPRALAPFTVHICLLDPKDEQTSKRAEILYKSLEEKGVDVFMDDRDEKPGVKFKDADLLGLPIRVNIGKKGLIKDEVELVLRKTRERETVSFSKGLARIESLIDKAF